MKLEKFYCNQCGIPFVINEDGTTNHVLENGNVDFNADGKHVAYGEIIYNIIGEILICDICKKAYVDNSNNDHLVCEKCIKEYFTES